MKKCFAITATKGNVSMMVTLMEQDLMRIETTVRGLRPRNRKQKKQWKQEASAFKRDGKGTYTSTECCTFNVKVFAMLLDYIKRDDKGDYFFAQDEEEGGEQ